jgi:hypothetical protein
MSGSEETRKEPCRLDIPAEYPYFSEIQPLQAETIVVNP